MLLDGAFKKFEIVTATEPSHAMFACLAADVVGVDRRRARCLRRRAAHVSHAVFYRADRAKRSNRSEASRRGPAHRSSAGGAGWPRVGCSIDRAGRVACAAAWGIAIADPSTPGAATA